MQNIITGAQIRAARSLIGITAEELAERARLGVATIRRAELIDGPTNLTEANAATLRAAIDAAGVTLIDPDQAGGPGVRLKAEAAS
jgi:transcriptional regulator with XRE-family HTH domain